MPLGGIAQAIGGLFGASKDAKVQERNAIRNIEYQKKFAKRGVRWKTRDTMLAAAEHKMHPLALLGMQTHSFAPVHIGSSDWQGAMSNAGQAIGQAASHYSPSAVTQRKQDQAMAGLAMERAHLENQLLRTRIASGIRTALQPGIGPGIPNNGNTTRPRDRDWETAEGE